MARILVVDDDALLLDLLGDTLEYAGHDVVTALNGEVCKSHLNGQQLPDLITLDCRLPDFPGVTLLESIRANARLKHIPIVFITASPEDLAGVPDDLYQALVEKPFPLDAILSVVRQYVGAPAELVAPASRQSPG